MASRNSHAYFVGRVGNPQQAIRLYRDLLAEGLHVEPDFLLGLALGPGARLLAAPEKTARCAPPVAVGVADEQHLAVALDHTHRADAERRRAPVDQRPPRPPGQAAERP